jgi:hypothetical protein
VAANQGGGTMIESEAREFVAQFSAAWATRDGDAFVALWHPDGQLHSPFYDRAIAGREMGKLNDLLKAQIPQLTWTIIDWTWRGDVAVIEWENTNRYGDTTVRWRGVDKVTVRAGKIIEEVVYVDTAPLHALRAGRPFDALVPLPRSLL